MSTRGAIARPVGEGFEGRYHHWDSYPEGLGATLFYLRNGFFGGDTDALLAYLVDSHPAGWSTINGKDLTRDPGFLGDIDRIPCVATVGDATCGELRDAHLCQTFGLEGHEDGPYPCGVNYAYHIGHLYEPDPVVEAYLRQVPECYCHGDRSEDEWLVTAENASGSGVEFAYVLEGARMLVLGNYHDDGSKAVGMFGFGDPDASWKILADVNLDGETPDWEAIQEVAWPSEAA